jgi:hypothetical protein
VNVLLLDSYRASFTCSAQVSLTVHFSLRSTGFVGVSVDSVLESPDRSIHSYEL